MSESSTSDAPDLTLGRWTSTIDENSELVRDFLTSNEPPIGSDFDALERLRTDIPAERASIIQEIAASKRRIRELRMRDQNLSSLLADVETVTSPVRFLPEEILGEIFTHTVEPCVGNSNESVDIRRGPWLPSYVCRRWRRVCLADPSFWVVLGVQIGSEGSENGGDSSKPSLLKLQLARSRELALDVTIHCDSLSLLGHESLIMTLASSSVRWKRLHIQAPALSMRSLVDDMSSFPMLQNIVVLQTAVLSVTGPIPWLQRCSEVRDFTTLQFISANTFQGVPWSHLRKFTVCTLPDYAVDDFIRILPMMKSLDSLCVESAISTRIISSNPNVASADRQHVFMPQLKVLRIMGDPRTICRIFDVIIAPRLEAVVMRLVDATAISLAETIRRSHCLLPVLGIKVVQSDWQCMSLDLVASVFTSVSTLMIDGGSGSRGLDSLLRSLVLPSSAEEPAPILFPRLRYLHVSRPPRLFGALLKMLLSRSQESILRFGEQEIAVEAIQRVVTSFQLPAGYSTKLDECRAAGITFARA